MNLFSLGFAGTLPESSGPWISWRTDSIPERNFHLLSQNPQPPPDKEQIIATEDFPENMKATAEGSKLQKVSTEFHQHVPECVKAQDIQIWNAVVPSSLCQS